MYGQAPQELKDAMNRGDIEGDYLNVQQGKTGKRLRIQMQNSGVPNRLGLLIGAIMLRNAKHISHHFILSRTGMRISQQMLRHRWDEAREAARLLPLPMAGLTTQRKYGNSNSRISGRKPRQRSLISQTPACCWATPNRR